MILQYLLLELELAMNLARVLVICPLICWMVMRQMVIVYSHNWPTFVPMSEYDMHVPLTKLFLDRILSIVIRHCTGIVGGSVRNRRYNCASGLWSHLEHLSLLGINPKRMDY